MYLKGIELTGFKSFADKTRLSFEPGVTSVVGPNGSGKSNISDAIRWVMGEMSAKSLRGSSMQDVIFAGTQARKPLGFAQVSLTLDNSDHAMDIEYDEVTVARRVYRSGEGEYYINGAACRLKDIHELFMDTGLGREGYSIIGQGKVNEIISGKADDRRYIFDEAAGISKFRHRKEEAERKLLQTEDNLVRINDIVSELSSQLEPLLRQSQKAKKYLDLREEMKKLEINVFIRSVEKLRQDIGAINEKFEIVTRQLADMQADSTKSDEEIERLNNLADSLDKEIEQKRAESEEAQLAAKGVLGEIEVLKNNIESNEKLILRIEQEIEGRHKKIDELDNAAKGLEESKIQKNEELISAQGQADELSGKNAEMQSQTLQLAAEVNTLKAEVIEKLNAITALKSELGSLEAFKKSFTQRADAIETERKSMGEELEKIESSLEEAKKSLDSSNERAKKSREALGELDAEINENHISYDELKKNADEKGAILSRELSKLQMLREMERDFEGFAKSVKGILTAHEHGRLGGAKIYGALSSLIEVGGRYATAVEALLGGALQNVVVDSERDAAAAISYLKENHIGRVTFLPVSAVRGKTLENEAQISTQKGYIGIASKLVTYNERYDGIVKSLLGRCVVVDSMDNAIAMSKKFGYKFRIATLEGELFNAGGSITGGSMNRSTGILSRASQIKELQASSSENKKELESLREKMKTAESALTGLEARRKGTDTLLRMAEQEAARAETELEHIKMMAEAKKNSGESIESELLQLTEQISDTNTRIAEMINRTTKAELDIEEQNVLIGEKEKELAELSQRQHELGEKLGEKNVIIAGMRKDVAAAEYMIGENVRAKSDTLAEIDEKKKDIEGIKDKNALICVQIEEKNTKIESEKAKSDEILAHIQELNAKRDETRALARRSIDESKEVREKVYALKEEQNRLDGRREKIENDIESATAKMWEEYEVTILSAKEYESDIGSVSAAKSRVGELRSAIRALGNVNVDAIEEYASVRERYDFLSNQTNDLSQAKESLEKLIESIQGKMKTQFKEQFEIINEKFTSTFSELFGGGRASLRLTDPEDILGSGVEIDAQPPGKKLQNLSLLSGGEMAFTAIALLFAILKVRPTPFCVLDEIEAALDESNVYRFADYVRKYSKKTQFILVTHRRGTMEAADLLYGVTMQEKGVSKLLTLKLDEAAAMSS